MSKLNTTASRNIKSTFAGGLRTGNRNVAPSPVTIIYGGGSSLPCPVAPRHPEPSSVDPTVAKCAAVARAARAAKRKARTPRAAKAKPAPAAKLPALRVLQDGRDFYNARRGTGELLHSFGRDVVANDFDTAGATKARALFRAMHPGRRVIFV